MANESLRRNPTSTGNRRVFTWAGWVKINKISTSANVIWNAQSSGNSEFNIGFVSLTGGFNIYDYSPSAYQYQYISLRAFKDFSNWFHLVVAVDTTQVREDDRFKIYINGVLYNGTYSTEIVVGGINYQTRMNTPGEINYIGQNVAGGSAYDANCELSDMFMIDGQALTPDVFGFYKQGKGYISAGSAQATDFRPGQWVPKTPRVIKIEINRRGGFGVNGFYLPMNDSKNFGADFHCDPNSIITLNEKLPQPRVGVASTAVGIGYTDALRADPYAANLVLAVPGIIGGQGSGYGDYSANIKGSGSNKTVTANDNAGVAVTASYYGSALSFDGSGDYFNLGTNADFNFGSGDFTIEFWRNKSRSAVESYVARLDAGGGSATSDFWFGNVSGVDGFYWYQGGTGRNVSSPSLSTGQWDHLAAVRYGNTIILYVNGVAVGVNTAVTYSFNNGTADFRIGGDSVNSGNVSYPFQGSIQDLRIYKGVAKYKGGFDVPRPYTPVGIATWRAVPDTTANNFATLNAVQINRPTLTAGNLNWSASTAYVYGQGTIGIPPTGKWVFEGRFSNNTSTDNYNSIGVGINTTPPASPFNSSGNYGINDASATFGQSFVQNGVRQGSITLPAGTIIQVLIDRDNNTMTFVKDGTLQTGTGSTVTIPSSVTLYPMIGEYNLSGQINFGQNPSFSGNTTAGTFTDSNSKGLFKYQPPSGFLSLCEDNLPTPAISDPGKYFRSVLYTGSSSARSIVGVGFTPDLVWIKERNGADNHRLVDSVRGPIRELYSSLTNAEAIDGGGVLSFDSDGFSLGNGNSYNESGINHVAWCWRAGAGTTSTNTNGSITSVVSVNQDAGFSIVSYTGNNTNGATIGHGLGKSPSMIIVKERNGASGWFVYHKSVGATKYLTLNATTSATTETGAGSWFFGTEPTSSVFTVGANGATNENGMPIISYCWAEIEGFSKAFSYVGNGNADGPLVYLNFKPAFVIIKQTNGTGDWYIFDSSRNSTNPVTLGLLSNTAQIDGDYTGWGDFLSNGFKIRRTDSAWNGSGSTYVGFAWAESPFQTANAK